MSERYFQRNEKDCLQCTLATLTGIHYDEIPEFHKNIADMNNPKDGEGDRFDKAVDNWLYDNGFIRIWIEMKYNADGLRFPQISITPFVFLGVLAKDGRKYSHSVLLEYDSKECRIIHDPKPDSDYDIRDLQGIELVVKR